MTAHNTLNHLTSEYAELRCAAILTMDIAQETHVLSNTFDCHARVLSPNLVSRQNRQKTSQPKPVTLDPCHDDYSLSSMTKCIIDLCFHPSILCNQPMHHYFQYSTFTLAPIALKLIIKCTASTLTLALTLAHLALIPTNKYTVITLKLTLKSVCLLLQLIKCTLKLAQKLKCTAYIVILHKYHTLIWLIFHSN